MGHTKGKWEIVNQNDFESEIMSNGLRIAEVKSFGKNNVFSDPSKEEREANAKLIAAAPDMLEALIKINGLCADASKIENGKVDYSEVAKISINAINKATK